MTGRRYPDNTPAAEMKPGGYALQAWTNPPHWQIRDPEGEIGSLRDHKVVVHEDDTISAEPSIAGGDYWHGWLRHGEWVEA